MDIETRNLLISLSEVDSITGGSNLNRLIKTIMKTDQVIYPKEDGIHSQFKSIIYHCTLWEKTTPYNDFNHLMVLLHLSSYLSRSVNTFIPTVYFWSTHSSHQNQERELEAIAEAMELKKDKLWEYNHQGMRLAVLAASGEVLSMYYVM